MAYDTTLDEVMAPPTGGPTRRRAWWRRLRLSARWPQMTQDSSKQIVVISGLFLAASSFDYRLTGGSHLLGTLACTLTCALMMAAMRKFGASPHLAIAGALTACVGIGLATIQFGLPLFGMIGLALTMIAVADVANGRNGCLVWLPPAFAIWSALDNSFALGLIAVACLTVGMLFDAWHSHRQVRKVFGEPVVLAASALFVLCGGLNLLRLAAQPFDAGIFLTAGTEAESMIIHSPVGAAFFATVMLSGVLLRSSPRYIAPHEMLLVTVFGTLSLFSAPLFVCWLLIWIPLAVMHVASLPVLERLKRFAKTDASKDSVSVRSVKHAMVAASVVAVTLCVAPWMQSAAVDRLDAPARSSSNLTPLIMTAETPRPDSTAD